MDESRFGLHTIVRHCWGLRDRRIVRPFQQKFDWDYVYGAISILDGEPVFCHLPTVSCEAVWEFLPDRANTARRSSCGPVGRSRLSSTTAPR